MSAHGINPTNAMKQFKRSASRKCASTQKWHTDDDNALQKYAKRAASNQIEHCTVHTHTKRRWIAIVTSMNYCTTEKCNVTVAISISSGLHAVDGRIFFLSRCIVSGSSFRVDSFKWCSHTPPPPSPPTAARTSTGIIFISETINTKQHWIAAQHFAGI